MDVGLQEPVIEGFVTWGVEGNIAISSAGHVAFSAKSHLSGNLITWPRL